MNCDWKWRQMDIIRGLIKMPQKSSLGIRGGLIGQSSSSMIQKIGRKEELGFLRHLFFIC